MSNQQSPEVVRLSWAAINELKETCFFYKRTESYTGDAVEIIRLSSSSDLTRQL